ncbi:hypothetical protein CYY_009487 [Polysphondylium violaceum]|uniref:Galactokinase n=1 Tax=Polysphondylium violaceum TaxID=133409 RepID=A0A8J4V0H0_9MYCE|nr:hypothetical protein CYY_009487 [Polysphondylium violaceum]
MDIFNPLLPSVVDNLAEVYENVESNQERYQILESKFKQLYNDKPLFYFRAPGRVNLIGEHVDYSGYPVLPFALQQDTIVAVSINNNNNLNIQNVNEKYTPKVNLNVDLEIEIDMANHHWTNYVLAAWKGVKNLGQTNSPLKALNLLYSGNVPTGSGVSSSSALVCVSTLAFTYINNLVFTKEELVDLSIKSERFVGIESGGMDQTISYLGEMNVAKLIEFQPLKTYDVTLPKSVSFIICNSLVESNKVITGGIYYNLRVVECRLAAVLLAHSLGLKWETVRKLKDVQYQSNLSLEQLIQKTEEILHKSAYTRQEVADILEMSLETLEKTYFPKGIKVAAQSFELYKRATHVFSETLRVYQFSNRCQNLVSNASHDLGALMNDSHFSCSKMFECSCPELDQLTTICREFALGSRLTGAGWGGATISIVESSKIESFLKNVNEKYYSQFDKSKIPVDSSHIIISSPSKGASIIPSSSI